MAEARFNVPGFLVVVDADGRELVETRRTITGLPRELAHQIEAELRAGLGDGCYVVFREAGGRSPLPRKHGASAR